MEEDMDGDMNIERYTCEIKTPVWTGDIDSKSDLVKSTGIIGSLRWWTEAILRGMDYFICDPTEEKNQCPIKGNNNESAKYCCACLIFGASGIRRIFKMYIDGGEKVFSDKTLNIRPSGRNRGWYLGSGLKGELNLNIVSLDKEFKREFVLVPLAISANWGAIGAKTQHGYGVIKLNDKIGGDFTGFESGIENVINSNRFKNLKIKIRTGNNDCFPNIKEMFFTKVQFKAQNNWWRNIDSIKNNASDQRITDWINSGSVPISPEIKNWLRYGGGQELWKTCDQNKDSGIENWLFGTTQRVCRYCFNKVRNDNRNQNNYWCENCKKSLKPEETMERMASKINISCAYKIDGDLWEFRVWGWIPKNGNPSWFVRDKFLDGLKASLNSTGTVYLQWNNLLGNQTTNHSLVVWREFDSNRDTVKSNEKNIGNFLNDLIDDKEVAG